MDIKEELKDLIKKVSDKYELELIYQNDRKVNFGVKNIALVLSINSNSANLRSNNFYEECNHKDILKVMKKLIKDYCLQEK